MALPAYYLITPPTGSWSELEYGIQLALDQGIRLIQLRCPQLSRADYEALATRMALKAINYRALFLLNCPLSWLSTLPALGYHMTSDRLIQTDGRPVSRNRLFSVACHHGSDVAQARVVDADLLTLSPVYATPSSPQRAALGWQAFASLCQMIDKPCFALGGLQVDQLALARQHGAHGIAAISALWPVS